MEKIVLSWTGDVGMRAEIAKRLEPLGVTFTDTITSKTTAVAVGQSPKPGKLFEAQLHNIPQVTPDFLTKFASSKRMPDFKSYLIHVEELSTPSRASRRLQQHAEMSPCAPRSEGKKRRQSALPTVEPRYVTEPTPSKRRMLPTRSISSNAQANASAKRPMHDSSHIRYASSEDPGAVVALEGLIGIGKSTLCNKLLQLYPDEVDVYREETNEKFLQLFYSDPKRYGFALQWGMLKSRIYQLRLAQHDTKHGRWPHRDLLFWDRSMIGDYTFALWNHLLGGISPQEMEAYESEFGGSVRQLEKIHFLKDIELFVLMNDEPSRCKVRVEVNRKNASEQGIPLPYYEGLDDIHYHMFIELMRHRIAKVLIQPWGEYDDAEHCRTLYEDAIAGRITLPSVIEEPSGLKVSALTRVSDTVLIYKNGQDIFKQYQLISSDTSIVEMEALKDFSDIYVPRDVMLVDPESKGINLDHLKSYNIKFYENAYKRVVLFHLGHNQNIHFYDSL